MIGAGDHKRVGGMRARIDSQAVERGDRVRLQNCLSQLNREFPGNPGARSLDECRNRLNSYRSRSRTVPDRPVRLNQTESNYVENQLRQLRDEQARLREERRRYEEAQRKLNELEAGQFHRESHTKEESMSIVTNAGQIIGEYIGLSFANSMKDFDVVNKDKNDGVIDFVPKTGDEVVLEWGTMNRMTVSSCVLESKDEVEFSLQPFRCKELGFGTTREGMDMTKVKIALAALGENTSESFVKSHFREINALKAKLEAGQSSQPPSASPVPPDASQPARVIHRPLGKKVLAEIKKMCRQKAPDKISACVDRVGVRVQEETRKACEVGALQDNLSVDACQDLLVSFPWLNVDHLRGNGSRKIPNVADTINGPHPLEASDKTTHRSLVTFIDREAKLFGQR